MILVVEIMNEIQWVYRFAFSNKTDYIRSTIAVQKNNIGLTNIRFLMFVHPDAKYMSIMPLKRSTQKR